MMGMHFEWGDFTDGKFARLKEAMQGKTVPTRDTFGVVRTGELRMEIFVNEDDKLDWNLYVGGVDTGYGYTMEKSYPYDYASGTGFDDGAEQMDYAAFRNHAEQRFTDYITTNAADNYRGGYAEANLLEKANAPLHAWE